MTDLKKLQKEVIKFRDERDWKQFHSPKDAAMALASEATEVLDEFKFKTDKQINDHLSRKKESVGHELADVLFWTLLMANDLDIDLSQNFKDKMKLNNQKYPVKKAKGNNKKYTEFK